MGNNCVAQGPRVPSTTLTLCRAIPYGAGCQELLLSLLSPPGSEHGAGEWSRLLRASPALLRLPAPDTHTPLGKSLGDPGPEIPFWQKEISFSFLAGLVLRFGSANAAGGSLFVLRQEFKQDDVSHAGSGRPPAPAEASLMKALCVPRRGFPITRNVLSPPPRTEVERSQARRAAASTMGKSSSCHPGAARRGLVSVPWRSGDAASPGQPSANGRERGGHKKITSRC